MSDDYIGLTFAYTVMVLTDLIGNTLVILVVMRNRTMQTPMNYLLVNLAVADMMVAIFIAIQFIFGPLYTHPDGSLGVFLCKFITGGTLTWTGAVSSVFNLVAISVERYYAILFPHSQKGRISGRNLRYVIAGAWVTAVLWNTPLFINVTYRYDIKRCGEQWPNLILPKIYSFGWNIVVGAIPIGIMTYMYTRIVKKLWFEKDNSTQLAVMKSRKKVTQMVIAVSVIYAVCWTPGLVMYFLAYMLPWESVHSVVHQVTIVLATFNSSINPIIYSLQSERFRRHLCAILCCGRPCGASQVEQESQENQNQSNESAMTS